ncbi:MAG: hypothetical protein EA369_03025 [Bradymonadales bacterium]|nr:MAG: hypothetical protein EA369_03025 [Bradymonadales bacterium]
MKIIFMLMLSAFVPTQGFAEAEWSAAPVHDVSILETFPVQYALSYERRCNDVAVKPVKWVHDSEVIVGVIVKNDPSIQCWREEEQFVVIKNINIWGDRDDPQEVTVLK